MKFSDISLLISAFHKGLAKGNEVSAAEFIEVNYHAMRGGFFVERECCNKETLYWAKEIAYNPNSTFYKKWEDVTSKSRFELFLDQVYHYFSTYGTDFSMGNGYTPNDGGEDEPFPFDKLVVIKAVSAEEYAEDIKTLLYSGIAIKSETVAAMVSFLSEYSLVDRLDIDKLANREAQALISEALNKLPEDKFALLRCLIYRYTGSTSIIKDKKSFRTIKNSAKQGKEIFDLSQLSPAQKKALSSIFYRFKPLFLAMRKTSENNKKTVNEIRRLARIYHQPFKAGFWESCLNNGTDETETLLYAKEHVDEIDNFKKISLLYGIKARLLRPEGFEGATFVVRNGKLFADQSWKNTLSADYLNNLYSILEDSLIEALKPKSCRVKRNKNVVLALPSSEKNFIGPYPMYSHLDIRGEDTIIGLYWRDNWGGKDLDLSFLAEDGTKYGWNASFYSEKKDVIFSGDMTSATPEASECFLFRKGVVDGLVKINVYYGLKDMIGARLYLGRYKGELEGDSLPVNYMCKKEDIFFSADLSFEEASEKLLAYILDGTMYLIDMGSGYGQVSHEDETSVLMRKLAQIKCRGIIPLEEILEKAGFEFVEDGAEVDLNDISVSEMIKLFA